MNDAPINGRPNGAVTPYLVVNGAAEAVEFYTRVFGAREIYRNETRDGKKLVHVHLRLNGASLMLCDPSGDAVAPPGASGNVWIHLNVDDADLWFQRALDHGAVVETPIADMFWGDRFGRVKDPFGHVWALASPSKRGAKPGRSP